MTQIEMIKTAVRLWRQLGRRAMRAYCIKRGVDMRLVVLARQLEAVERVKLDAPATASYMLGADTSMLGWIDVRNAPIEYIMQQAAMQMMSSQRAWCVGEMLGGTPHRPHAGRIG